MFIAVINAIEGASVVGDKSILDGDIVLRVLYNVLALYLSKYRHIHSPGGVDKAIDFSLEQLRALLPMWVEDDAGYSERVALFERPEGQTQ
jgi:hypothetical protein